MPVIHANASTSTRNGLNVVHVRTIRRSAVVFIVSGFEMRRMNVGTKYAYVATLLRTIETEDMSHKFLTKPV
jgi:hypothetical protein